MCGVNWPHHSDYEKCPVCLTSTDTVVRGKPITFSEAKKLANEAEFERFYSDWDERRKGPSPDEKGRQEGKAIYELEQAYGEKLTLVKDLDESGSAS
jgi:hypothetical protein